jgi:hypothetical protein
MHRGNHLSLITIQSGRAEVVLLGDEHPHDLPTVGRDLCQRFGFLIGDEALGKVGED